MIIITARASVRPDQRDAAIAAAHDMRKLTLDEPGCIDYRFWNATDDAGVFLVFEQWEDQTALDIHLAAPHTSAFLTDIGPAIEETVEVTRFEVSNHGPLFRSMSDHVESAPMVVRNIADLAPKLAALTDEIVFGDIWERPDLSKRDRSLITMSALLALYRPEQLSIHLRQALDNGLTQEEIVEAITHLAFYTGWPSAFTAINLARSVFAAA